jgi:hypothetical protein
MSETYKYRQQNRHKFHALMSVLTCGVWLFTGWPAMIAWNYFRSGRKSYVRVPE